MHQQAFSCLLQQASCKYSEHAQDEQDPVLVTSRVLTQTIVLLQCKQQSIKMRDDCSGYLQHTRRGAVSTHLQNDL